MSNLLPPNATDLEKNIDAVGQQSSSLPVDIETIGNPEQAPADFLPWIAWALSVDEWFPDWSDTQKRNAIESAYEIHKIKGTPASIKRILALLGYGDATVVEGGGGFTLNGDVSLNGDRQLGDGNLSWAEYQVFLTSPVTIKTAAQIRRILNSTAPARCRLAELNFTQALNELDGSWQLNGEYSLGVA